MIRVIMVTFIVGLSLFAVHVSAALLMEERRFSLKKTAFLWLLAGVVLFFDLLLCYRFLPETVRLPASLMISYLYYWATFMYASADGFWKKCYLWVSYGSIFCISWTIATYLCRLFFAYLPMATIYIIRGAMNILICVPLLFLYRKYGRPLIREVSGFRSKNWRSMCGVSILYFFIFVILLSKIKMEVEVDSETLVLFILIVLTFIAANILCISNIYYMKKESRDELVKQNIDYLTAYLESARKTEEENRRLRHDIRHHDEQIASMARENNTEAILSYLGKKSKEDSLVLYSPNIMVNCILTSYAKKAKEAQIGFSAQADTQAKTKIVDTDFVAILANLLENALNASIEIKATTPIQTYIRTVGTKTVITVSNECKPNLKLENGLPINRSVGIDSIIYSANRYNGVVNYKIENSICTVCVILNTK